MDDERQAELAREGDLGAKDALGDVARRVIIVIVETGFADADAFGMRGERRACAVEVLGPLAGRLVRMRADGEIDARRSARRSRPRRGLRDPACRW